MDSEPFTAGAAYTNLTDLVKNHNSPFYGLINLDEFVKSHDGDDEVKSSRGKARES